MNDTYMTRKNDPKYDDDLVNKRYVDTCTLKLKEIIKSQSDKIKDLKDLNEYSITETVIGKWIDGKPIYRKVIQLSQNISASATNVSIQLPLTNIDRIWLNHKSTIVESNSIRVPFPYTNQAVASYTIGYYMAVTDGVPEVRIRKGNGLGILSEEFVVEYTKTTD